MCSVSYALFIIVLVRHHGRDSLLAQAIGKDRKGNISTIIYIIALAVSFFSSNVSFALYIVVECIWFIPDKRIEKMMVIDKLPYKQ
jgi:hypothetical protein